MYLDSYIVPLDIYPAEIKVQGSKIKNVSSVGHCVQQQRNLKWPKSLPVEERLNKPWFGHTVRVQHSCYKDEGRSSGIAGKWGNWYSRGKSKLQNNNTQGSYPVCNHKITIKKALHGCQAIHTNIKSMSDMPQTINSSYLMILRSQHCYLQYVNNLDVLWQMNE